VLKFVETERKVDLWPSVRECQ